MAADPDNPLEALGAVELRRLLAFLHGQPDRPTTWRWLAERETARDDRTTGLTKEQREAVLARVIAEYVLQAEERSDGD